MTIISTLMATSWAMNEQDLDTLVSIAQRENAVAIEALEKYRAENHHAGEVLQVRENVAILNVRGPLIKYATMFSAVSGVASYDILMRDLQVALDDDAIDAVIFKIDSPGGQVSGCDELAKAIYAARDQKKIVAYVTGMAASGGYWIASAAERIVASDASIIGNIGVILGLTDTSERDEKSGVKKIKIVSSQSPSKLWDPATKEGRSEIHKTADGLAQVFIDAVAKHRGIDSDTVIKDFGAGGVEIGAKAAEIGMVDEVGQFEDLVAELQNKTGVKRRNTKKKKGSHLMTEEELAAKAAADKAIADATLQATADAQTRMKGILSCDFGKKCPATAEHLAYSTKLSTEEATSILEMAAKDADALLAVAGNTGSTDTTATTAEDDAKSYEQQKADAGALGLATPEITGGKKLEEESDEAIAESWTGVIKEHNAA